MNRLNRFVVLGGENEQGRQGIGADWMRAVHAS